jgi:hypothetical protein
VYSNPGVVAMAAPLIFHSQLSGRPVTPALNRTLWWT